jgi:hypothetical protein
LQHLTKKRTFEKEKNKVMVYDIKALTKLPLADKEYIVGALLDNIAEEQAAQAEDPVTMQLLEDRLSEYEQEPGSAQPGKEAMAILKKNLTEFSKQYYGT